MSWVAVSGSVRGAAHKVGGAPLQDAVRLISDDDFLICAVADGHGSSDCKYSADGARLAADIFCEYFRSIAHSENACDYLRANREVSIPKKLEQLWKETVSADHIEKGRGADPDIYRLYGTTLIGALMTQAFIFAIQIGDGDILAVSAEGVTERLIETDIQLGTETNSLCMKESWKYFKSSLFAINEDAPPPVLVICCTDGYANSFLADEDFLSIGCDYLSCIRESGVAAVGENLDAWLNHASENGSGDDISVVVAAVDELISKVS